MINLDCWDPTDGLTVQKMDGWIINLSLHLHKTNLFEQDRLTAVRPACVLSSSRSDYAYMHIISHFTMCTKSNGYKAGAHQRAHKQFSSRGSDTQPYDKLSQINIIFENGKPDPYATVHRLCLVNVVVKDQSIYHCTPFQ